MRRPLVALVLAALLALPALPAAASEETHAADGACSWAFSHLTVQVVPPTHPSLYTKDANATGEVSPLPYGATATPWSDVHALAVVDAVEAWERAMHAYAAAEPAAAHLAGVTMEAYVVSPETPLSQLESPHIRVVFAPTLVYPVGTASTSCAPAHEPMYCPPDEQDICVLGGSQVALTQWSVYSMTANDTFNIALHELGHSLGLGHVAAPLGDIMNPVYGHPVGDMANPRQCASALNLAQLSENFAWLGGAPYAYWPQDVGIPVSHYRLVC